MNIKDIYIYKDMESWLDETPDATIKGSVNSKNGNIIEITDENGLTQIINMGKLFAVVY